MVESTGEIIEEQKQPRLIPIDQRRRTASFGSDLDRSELLQNTSFHSSASEIEQIMAMPPQTAQGQQKMQDATPNRTINFSGEYNQDVVRNLRSMIASADNAGSFIGNENGDFNQIPFNGKEALRSTIGGTNVEQDQLANQKFLKQSMIETYEIFDGVRTTESVSTQPGQQLPCPFLKFVSQTRDIEALKFQLEVNHIESDRREEPVEAKQTIGHKIFKIFKPDTPPHQRAAKKLLLEATKPKTRRVQQPDEAAFGNKPNPLSNSVMTRNKVLSRFSSSFVQDSLFFKPIYKQIDGPYTSQEWEVILSNSVAKSAELARKDRYTACRKHILNLDHLSKTRLKQSFVQGLHIAGCDDLRKFVWLLLCNVPQQRYEFADGVFQKFLSEENDYGKFRIGKDLSRTVPGNSEFMLSPSSGKNRLFNVLKAYTAYDPQVGYCQGMNFIASMLLRVIPDQEDAFWAFVFLMFERDWRTLFSDETKKVTYLLKDLDAYLKVNCRSVYRHVQRDEFASWEASFASQLITLFICDYEFVYAQRVMDLFMLEGEQILVDLLATMVQIKKKKILQLDEIELMDYLRKDMAAECFAEYPMEKLLGKRPLVPLVNTALYNAQN